MTHKHSATDLFPAWYKSIDPIISSGTVGFRIAAIDKLLENNKVDFWLDVIRLALGLPQQSSANTDSLIKEFKDADVNFPLTSNENIIKVLAQISLCFLFESSESTNRLLIAEAVNNVVFFGQFDATQAPFYEYAVEVIAEGEPDTDPDSKESLETLTTTLDKLQENVDDEEDEAIVLDDNDHIAIIKSIKYLTHQNDRLKEESNVLWWLFGSYSSINKAYFQDVPLKILTATAPKELISMSKDNKRFLSAKHILSKVMHIVESGGAENKNFSMSEIIAAVPGETKNSILAGLTTPSELTPCLFALLLSTQFEEATVWNAAFNSKVQGASLDKKFAGVEIAYQLYNELLFLTH
jgi:hypothetical protein